jgi:hypothetical protein
MKLNGREHLGNPEREDRIILKWMLDKWTMKVK